MKGSRSRASLWVPGFLVFSALVRGGPAEAAGLSSFIRGDAGYGWSHTQKDQPQVKHTNEMSFEYPAGALANLEPFAFEGPLNVAGRAAVRLDVNGRPHLMASSVAAINTTGAIDDWYSTAGNGQVSIQAVLYFFPNPNLPPGVTLKSVTLSGGVDGILDKLAKLHR